MLEIILVIIILLILILESIGDLKRRVPKIKTPSRTTIVNPISTSKPPPPLKQPKIEGDYP